MKRISAIAFSVLIASGLLGATIQGRDAWTLFQKRDYKEALKEFNKQEAQFREWAPYHDAVGWCHYFLGDYDAARKKFADALDLQSDYKWSLMGISAVDALQAQPIVEAQSYLSSGRYREARDLFRQIHQGETVANSNEAAAAAMSGEGWCDYYLGQYPEAIRSFHSSLKKKNGEPDAYRGIAYCEYAQGLYRDALAALQLSFAVEPAHYEARLTAGWCHYWREDYRKALKEFEVAAESLPGGYGAYSGIGWCRERMGDDEGAFQAFSDAVRLSPYAFDAELRSIVETKPEWKIIYSLVGWSALRAHLDSWALAEFQTASALDPGNLDAVRGIAFALFRLGQYEQALLEAERAEPFEGEMIGVSFPVTLPGGSSSEIAMNLELLRSWIRYRQGLYDQALDGFRSVRRERPEWVDALCGEGWCLFNQGNFPASEKAFQDANRILPGYSDATTGLAAVESWRYAKYNEAWAAIYQGDFQRAIELFDEIARGDDRRFPPERLDLIHASKGWAHSYAGDEDLAEEMFRSALEINENLGLANQGWGQLLMRKEDWGGAIERLTSARHDPALATNAQLTADLGFALLEYGDLDLAREELDLALSFDPNSVTAIFGKALLYLRQGLMVDARVDLERAIYFSPGVASREEVRQAMEEDAELQKLHSALGWAWFYRGAYEEAEKEFQLAIEKDPLEKSVQKGLGIMLLRQGRISDAEKPIEAFLQGAPRRESGWGEYSQTMSEYAWTLYGAGKYREGLKWFRKLKELQQGEKTLSADPFDGAGWCYLRMGKLSEAKREFMEAISIAPRHESSLTGLESLQEMQ